MRKVRRPKDRLLWRRKLGKRSRPTCTLGSVCGTADNQKRMLDAAGTAISRQDFDSLRFLLSPGRKSPQINISNNHGRQTRSQSVPGGFCAPKTPHLLLSGSSSRRSSSNDMASVRSVLLCQMHLSIIYFASSRQDPADDFASQRTGLNVN